MRQKITVFRLAVLADCFLCTGGCAAMAVVRLCVAGISRADARMRAVVVGCPRAIVMSKRIAVLKGFRALFAADGAGLVIDRFCYAGRGRFQILVVCFFSCEVMRLHFAVFTAASLADRFCSAGRRAAVAVARFRVACISGADAGVRAVVVGCPFAPVVTEDVAGCEGGFIGCALGAQTADGAGLVINRFLRAGGGGFQILFRCRFFRETVGC